MLHFFNLFENNFFTSSDCLYLSADFDTDKFTDDGNDDEFLNGFGADKFTDDGNDDEFLNGFDADKFTDDANDDFDPCGFTDDNFDPCDVTDNDDEFDDADDSNDFDANRFGSL